MQLFMQVPFVLICHTNRHASINKTPWHNALCEEVFSVFFNSTVSHSLDTQYPASKHHWCIHQQPFCMSSLRKNLETNISKDLFFLLYLFIARSFFSGYVRLEVPDAFKL